MKIRFLDQRDLTSYKQLRITALKTDPTAFGSTHKEEINYTDQHFQHRLVHNNDQLMVGAFIG
ncbi:hypothetical protein FCS83_09790 [Oenococcus sp. UCMA 17063]|nr:hypothetical protein [Oenococcus sp. UCMA 17063]